MNNAQNNARKQRKRPRGKPFEPGNAWAFKPGQTGNPGGRPKSRHLSRAAEKYLELPSAECQDITNAEHIMAVVGAQAKAGVEWAVKWLADRTEGRSAIRWQGNLDLTTHDEADLRKEVMELLAEYTAAVGGDEAQAREMLAADAPSYARYLRDVELPASSQSPPASAGEEQTADMSPAGCSAPDVTTNQTAVSSGAASDSDKWRAYKRAVTQRSKQ